MTSDGKLVKGLGMRLISHCNQPTLEAISKRVSHWQLTKNVSSPITWQSPLRILSTSPSLTRYSTEFLWGSYALHRPIILTRRVWALHSAEAQCYGAWNFVMHSKYAMEYFLISIWDCNILLSNHCRGMYQLVMKVEGEVLTHPIDL